MKSAAYGVQTATSPIAPMSIERREPGHHDVLIDILYCGICHSDIHQARNEWGGSSLYPMAPRHNIVSVVEMIDAPYINEAYERMLKSDVKYRFVVDIASLK